MVLHKILGRRETSKWTLLPTHRVGSSRWEPVSLEFYILSMHIDINYILMAMKRSRLLTVVVVVVGCLFLSSSMQTDTYQVG